MGAGAASQQFPPPKYPMRVRSEPQVPKCFRCVKCPYPQGQTVHGTYGAINYTLVGPENGEVVVCFHGLNGSRMLYQELGEFLSKQGNYRVLSFDLYGHGLSNAPHVDLCPCRSCSQDCHCRPASCGPPRGRYDLAFFVEQTDELLELVGLGDAPLNLIGFSLGGTVAVAFAQKFPSRVLRLVAMSPSGFIPKVPASYYLLRASWWCLIPIAPHVLCTCWYKRDRFARSLRGEGQEVDDEVVDNLWSRFVWQLYVKRGVASATLAVCHRVPWFNLKSLFKDAGRSPRPVLLVWGEKDSLNPPATVGDEVKRCFSNVHLMIVQNAGHIAICDKPRQVFLSILGFLQLPENTTMSTAQFTPTGPRSLRLTPPTKPVAPPGAEGKGAAAASRTSQSSLCSDGPLASDDFRHADRAAQMPVPLILGHREDLAGSSNSNSETL